MFNCLSCQILLVSHTSKVVYIASKRISHQKFTKTWATQHTQRVSLLARSYYGNHSLCDYTLLLWCHDTALSRSTVILVMFSKNKIVNCSLDISNFLLKLNLSVWHGYFLIATAMFATAQAQPILQPSQFRQLIVNIPNH